MANIGATPPISPSLGSPMPQKSPSLQYLLPDTILSSISPWQIEDALSELQSLRITSIPSEDPKFQLFVIKMIMLSKLQPSYSLKEINEGVKRGIGTHVDQADLYFPVVVGHILPMLDASIEGEWAYHIKTAKLLFDSMHIVNKTGIFLYQYVLLQEIKKQLDDILLKLSPQERKELKTWITNREKTLQKELSQFSWKTALSLPGMLSRYIKIFAPLPSVIKSGFWLFGSIADSAICLVNLREASDQQKTQKKWLDTQHVQNAPKDQNSAQKLLKKRKDAFRNKNTQAWPHFKQNLDKITEQLEKNPFMNSERICKHFKNEGIDLAQVCKQKKIPLKKNHLIEAMKNNTDFQKALLKNKIEKSETITQLTKQGMKTLTEKKQRIERSFFRHNYYQKLSSFLLALGFAVLSTLPFILGSAATTVLLYSGVGIFLIGTAAIGYGLWFEHKHKPNLFNCSTYGLHTKLALYTIPQAWHQFKAQRTLTHSLINLQQSLDAQTTLDELQALLEKERIAIASLPKSLRKRKWKTDKTEGIITKRQLEKIKRLLEKQLERCQKQQKKYERELSRRNKKIENWDKTIHPLKKKLELAALKDFALATNLETIHRVQGLGAINFSKEIAKGLLEAQDEENEAFLKEKMGIDLQQIRKQKKTAPSELLTQQLRKYFVCRQEELIDFIKRQNEISGVNHEPKNSQNNTKAH